MRRRCKEIRLSELSFCPAERSGGIRSSQVISIVLQKTFEWHRAASGEVLALPSLTALARFFQTSHLQVYDALQHLRKRGYDYSLQGMEAPILFWYCPSHTRKALQSG